MEILDPTKHIQGRAAGGIDALRTLRAEDVTAAAAAATAAGKKGDKYIRFKLNFLLGATFQINGTEAVVGQGGNPISDRRNRTDARKHVHKHGISISGQECDRKAAGE